MYKEQKDENRLLEYWREERTYPKWWREADETWNQTEEEFLDFCHQCHKIYELDDVALLYLEKPTPKTVNIHFSLKRGCDAYHMVNDLVAIRNETFKTIELIFGWVHIRNKGLRKILEDCGFYWHGFSMFYGQTKVSEWRCHSCARSEYFISKPVNSVLSLV